MILLFLSLLVFERALCVKPNSPNSMKHFIYNTYNYDTRINVYVNNETEQIMDFNEDTDLWNGYPTRIHVSTNDSEEDYPVFITAMQQKGMSSWELPQVVPTSRGVLLLDDMARTLCPHDAGSDIKTENRPTVHVTTENPKNLSVDIKLRRVTDFYVELDKELSLNVTPSTPKYYFFSFDQNPWNVSRGDQVQGLPIFNYTIPKSVIVIVDSDDDLCATVSIQNNSCPVFDNENDVLYQGYHLTMTTKGGITLTQSRFPRGFYVVFVVKESDAQCTGASETERSPAVYNTDRTKTFKFRVIATVSYKEYAVGAAVLLAVVALVAAFVLVVAVPFRDRYQVLSEAVLVDEEPPAARDDVTDDTAPLRDDNGDTDERWTRSNALTVGRLTQLPADSLARRSDRYFWGALTLAVVYALPVVQLLFTYQKMVFATGDQDLCYYNFLCAHPLGGLSDFNHVWSNVGYLLLGGVFLLQVRARRRARIEREGMGIPQHYGLLYAMGLALCMEGFLSACYHLCPNKMNFQFDSSFMYVTAVLVMVKLYQNRHSDLIPSAHATFMLLALIMSIGVFGILCPSVYFSIGFTLLHLSTCLVLTLRIYYAGSFRMEPGVFGRAWTAVRTHGSRVLIPAHTARAVLLALANVANWTFAIYSLSQRNEDFARQLLAILMGNAFLYTMFYICMKLIHREKILPHTWVYIVCAHVAWIAALSQFVNGNTRWSESPALSRRRNGQCSALGLLDGHDLWHVSSAAAVLLCYNVLLTCDDALARTPRHRIATF